MSNLPTQADIDAIDREIAAAREVLRTLKERRHAMLVAEFDVAVGSIVKDTGKRHAGRLGQVYKVAEPWRLGLRPWVDVYLIKKDGTVGRNTACLFTDWELVR